MLNLPYDYGLEIIKRASEKDIERIAWELWLTIDDKNERPFGAFLREFKEPKVANTDRRTDEEIIEDAEYILTLLKRSE